MSANVSSIEVDYSGSYTVVKYQFEWANFSRIDGNWMLIGDVFEVKDFFSRLYGDGAVYVTYPSQYSVETVLPAPYEQNASTQTLTWLGTADFSSGQPSIVLKENSASSTSADTMRQYAILITVLVIIAAGLSLGFYMFRRRGKKNAPVTSIPRLANLSTMEDSEEKILKLLESSGGSLHQSAIADQCKFSRAKTSQLLTELEKKAIIKRYKKGRDKVVVLQEEMEKAKDKKTNH
jgi:uncharacterized membrane protein